MCEPGKREKPAETEEGETEPQPLDGEIKGRSTPTASEAQQAQPLRQPCRETVHARHSQQGSCGPQATQQGSRI